MALSKRERRVRIRHRIRKKISGTADVPRMSVFRSNKHIYVQLIDDLNGVTLASASSKDKGLISGPMNKKEMAAIVGKSIAEKAKTKNIESVLFDRGGYLYHGRVKMLADAARNEGLKF
ncbi:MAG: 50S ribosomal protein L18 [Bacteroidia bacterium]|nr:MAG: 50S ribosomal protein L18 [Bacteroidia bacterium]